MPAVNWYIQNPENLSNTIIVSTPEITPKLETPLAGFFYSAPEAPALLDEYSQSLLYSTNMIAKYCGKFHRGFAKFRAIDNRYVIMLGLNYCEQIYFYKILDTRTDIVDNAPKNLLQSQYDEYARYILCVHGGVRNVPFATYTSFYQHSGKEYPAHLGVKIFPGDSGFWMGDAPETTQFLQWVEDTVAEHELGE